MTKYERIRGVIRRVYEDGRQHGIGELRETCRADGIDLETDRHALNNVLFQMKKKRKTLNDSLNKKELSLRLKRLKESKRTISFAIMS